MPAFKHARRNSTLAALVSSEPKKLKQLGRRYGVARTCGYDDVDELLQSIATGRPVRLDMQQRRRRPDMQQEIRSPPVPRQPDLVNVKPASQ